MPGATQRSFTIICKCAGRMSGFAIFSERLCTVHLPLLLHAHVSRLKVPLSGLIGYRRSATPGLPMMFPFSRPGSLQLRMVKHLSTSLAPGTVGVLCDYSELTWRCAIAISKTQLMPSILAGIFLRSDMPCRLSPCFGEAAQLA